MSKAGPDSGEPLYGTFKGVFLPSLLAVFGVVMFLRMGWMVGQVGIVTTLIIVLAAFVIAFLTALSISATVTNMRVGGGGAYFIISRSLGIEIGTALGLLLYLAQSLGISFYLAGFAESVTALFPAVPAQWVAIGALAVLGAVAFKSADLMVKLQIPIFLVIVGGLAAFYVGGAAGAGPATAEAAVAPEAGFWEVFAVFFPAVTGIISGIGLSGQLREPAKALPRGMLAAMVVAGAVFVSIPLVLSNRVSADILRSNMMIMGEIALWKPVLLAALWAAALSSAVSAILSAPRTLQALAQDRVLPRILGRGFRTGDTEPRVATTLSVVIAMAGILAGDLNAIAPILSMIYLTAFVTLNFSAGIESLIKAPSWRPTFKVPATLSLAGALAAMVVMLMIDAGSGLLAMTATGLIYYLMLRRNMRAHWGDARHGIMMLLARYTVQRLQDFRFDPHSWKPHFLVMTGSPARNWPMIDFVDRLNQNAGFVTLATVVPASTPLERTREMEQGIRGFLNERNLVGLARVLPASDWQDGCVALINHYGLGKVRPDTIVFGIPTEVSDQQGLARVLTVAASHGRNVLLLRLGERAAGRPAGTAHGGGLGARLLKKKVKDRILVWWGGKRQNASFMIALAYLYQISRDGDDAELVFQTVVQRDTMADETRERLEDFTKRARLEARTNVIVTDQSQRPLEVVAQESGDAAMVFLGVRAPDKGEAPESYQEYVTGLITATRSVGNLALVMASDEIHLARLFR